MSSSMRRAPASPGDVGDRGARLVPTVRSPRSAGDRPIGAEHQPVGAEAVERDLDGRARSRAVQPGGEQVFSPETLAQTFGSGPRGGAASVPFGHRVGADRRLAEVVDHDRQRGKRSGKHADVAEVARKDDGSSRMSPRSSSWARLSSTADGGSSGVGLVMDQVANPSQRRLSRRARRDAPRRSGERETSHAVTAAIQSCSAAWAKSGRCRRRCRRDWTRIVRSIPHASSRGSRSAGSKSRAIVACSGVIHGIGSRRRFQKC